MREIVLDTETTGMDPEDGHKVIEIGCVELVNHLATGKTYHVYINPEREVPAEAVAVHGLTQEFLKDKQIFGEILGDFSDFLGDAKLVIHNAEFDLKFLNAEMAAFGFPALEWKRVVDTLALARKKFPGAPANLDALCRRFEIDNSERDLHGALLDAQLLAEVYLELLGGRQHGLAIENEKNESESLVSSKEGERSYHAPREFPLSQEESLLHEQMLEKIQDPLWKKNA